ncbi:hypothetical protein SAMN06295920_10477 [Rhizorhabdus histidinilytica]|uniref:Uncharacterized protein n=1 Tax=Rhizorhabdus histidinilytica TaxID=439228 RepID=A0A1T5CHY2_9SPHN|nr:hypothetical protein SAMN06295920_10477 [Rhizorhabdus histidinilytica]
MKPAADPIAQAWEAYDAAALECHRMRIEGIPADQRVEKELEAVRLHQAFYVASLRSEPASQCAGIDTTSAAG